MILKIDVSYSPAFTLDLWHLLLESSDIQSTTCRIQLILNHVLKIYGKYHNSSFHPTEVSCRVSFRSYARLQHAGYLHAAGLKQLRPWLITDISISNRAGLCKLRSHLRGMHATWPQSCLHAAMHGRVDASVHEGFSLHHACRLPRRAAVLGSKIFFFFFF